MGQQEEIFHTYCLVKDSNKYKRNRITSAQIPEDITLFPFINLSMKANQKLEGSTAEKCQCLWRGS